MGVGMEGAYAEIQSIGGRYASYCKAYLVYKMLLRRMQMHFFQCESDLFFSVLLSRIADKKSADVAVAHPVAG